MKLPRRQFLHLAAGAVALPAVSAYRAGASLSGAAGAPDRSGSCRQLAGHHRARDGSMAVGAAGPAIRRRQPAGRQRQYRHRSGRARARGRLLAAVRDVGECHQRVALRQSPFQFHPRHRAGGEHCQDSPRHGGQSVGSGEDGSRVHRLCQGQSGQDQHGVERQCDPAPCRRRAVQDDGRRRSGPRSLPRRAGGDARSAQRAGASHVRRPAVVACHTSGPASCARSP